MQPWEVIILGPVQCFGQFLLLLTTSAMIYLEHSRNLGSTLLATTVQVKAIVSREKMWKVSRFSLRCTGRQISKQDYFCIFIHSPASHPSSALTLTQLRIFIIPLANEFHNESDENGAARRARPLRVIHCREKRYGIQALLDFMTTLG